MKIFEILSLPIIVAVLVAMVNVLTEVTKKLFDVKRAQTVVIAWAVVLSVAVAIAAAVLQGWLAWWMILLAVCVGILAGALVAYVAMFGYDELYGEIINIATSLIAYLNGGRGDGNEEA